MITNSDYEPRCYQVTKVQEMTPQGVIKLSLKQDDFNEIRDNPLLRICDYYTEEGNIRVNITPSINPDVEYTSTITYKVKNDDGELIPSPIPVLSRGTPSYFAAQFFIDGVETHIDPEWKVEMIDDGDYSEDDIKYYTNLISVTEFDDSLVALKPGKAGSLVGKTFRLSVCDANGNYYSSIDLEVI